MMIVPPSFFNSRITGCHPFINPFPATVAYSTCAVYARNKYFCCLHKCCCQPITNIFALDLDTNTCIRSRSDLSLRSRSNSHGLDLEPRPSLRSRSNGRGLDLEPWSSLRSRSNGCRLDLEPQPSLRSRSNGRRLDLEPRPSLRSRSNGRGLDLELWPSLRSRSKARPQI